MKKFKLLVIGIITASLFSTVALAAYQTTSVYFYFANSYTSKISDIKFQYDNVRGEATFEKHNKHVDINMTLAEKKPIGSGYTVIKRCFDLDAYNKEMVYCNFTDDFEINKNRRYDSYIILNSGSSNLSGEYKVINES